MHPVLRLYEDVLSNAETVEFSLPPLARFIFVVHGSAMIGEQSLNDGESWQGERAVIHQAGAARRHLLALGAHPRRPGQHGGRRARHDDAREAHRISRDDPQG